MQCDDETAVKELALLIENVDIECLECLFTQC